MSILKYLQRKDGPLPNPVNPLSEHISPRAIEKCNESVSAVMQVKENVKSGTSTPKRGKYAKI